MPHLLLTMPLLGSSLVEVGDPAPDFDAIDHEGRRHRLTDLRGELVVLYFYPKDDTPGCTTEACGFRDAQDALDEAGVTVLGVSTQGRGEHRRFAEKYDLNFPLLVDEGNEISKAYGAYGTFGILPLNKRVTVLIDDEGIVREVWDSVTPSGHAREVLARARELGTTGDDVTGGSDPGTQRAVPES